MRTIAAELAAELQRPEIAPIILAEIDTADGMARAWSGVGTLRWDGRDFIGTGTFGGIEMVMETTDGAANGVVYVLSGIPQDIVALAVGSIRHNKVAQMWLGALGRDGKIVGAPCLLSRTLTDVPELVDDGEGATIRLMTESRSIDQQRARVRRFTTEDQKIDYPNDRGFEYVEALQDRKIVWGRR